MKYTLQEWLDEGAQRFGEDINNWRFVCPACGRVNIGREFKELGASTNSIYFNCIGRYNGKGAKWGGNRKKGEPPPEFGCDWSAGGLFATLGNGDSVVNETGEEIDVFAFAAAEVA